MIFRVIRLAGDTSGNTWDDECFDPVYVESSSRQEILKALPKSFGGYRIEPCSIYPLCVAVKKFTPQKYITAKQVRAYNRTFKTLSVFDEEMEQEF